MNKPAYFFDVNYLGNDLIVENFAFRSHSEKNKHNLGTICNLNGRYSVRSNISIDRGEIIETIPFVILHNNGISKEPEQALIQMDSMFVLEDQSEYSKQNGPRLIIAGGNGSFYRHSFTPNAYTVFDHVGKVIEIKALERIELGHEITLYRYGSLIVMKQNMEVQKFYAERQKQLEENKVDTAKFRSMQANEIKNIETIEIKSNDIV